MAEQETRLRRPVTPRSQTISARARPRASLAGTLSRQPPEVVSAGRKYQGITTLIAGHAGNAACYNRHAASLDRFQAQPVREMSGQLAAALRRGTAKRFVKQTAG